MMIRIIKNLKRAVDVSVLEKELERKDKEIADLQHDNKILKKLFRDICKSMRMRYNGRVICQNNWFSSCYFATDIAYKIYFAVKDMVDEKFDPWG